MDYFLDANQCFAPSLDKSLPLIHMTRDWETLKSILRYGLMPQYCTESISGEEDTIKAAFPMISCSNLSIDEARNGLKSYGTVGIALDQSWGQRNNFNPVLYLDRNSDLTEDFIDSFRSISGRSIAEIESCLRGVLVGEKHQYVKIMMKLFSHTKNYEGKLIRQGGVVLENYQFGLEREWRKVIQQKEVQYFLIEENLKNKNAYNQKVSTLMCDFEFKDIRYIILETDHEKECAKSILMKKYGVSTIPDTLFKFNEARYVPDEG